MPCLTTISLPRAITACFTVMCFVITALVSAAPAPAANAQSAAPDLPRLAVTDMNYQGAFRLERFVDDVSRLAYSNARIAVGADGSSIFITSHPREEAIAEYPIADPSFATTLEELPVAGPPLQPWATVLDRAPSGNAEALDRIAGLHLIDGVLAVNAYEYYDAPADNTDTTMTLADPANLAQSEATGWAQMNGAMHAAGWLSPIPVEWQSSLGGTHISGMSSGIPIISRTSAGPSAFAVNLDSSLSGVGGATALLDFDLQNGLVDVEDLSNESGSNDLWTNLSTATYGFIVPGTSTYFTIGRSGGHDSGVSYGPSARGKGYHPNDATDMSPYYWLWDVDDLVAVRDGSLLPHEVRPYDYGPIDLPFADFNHDEWADVGGAAFDPDSGRLYLALARVDRIESVYSPQPVILTYTFNPPSIIDPAEQIDPADPAEPIDPADPAEPIGPADPADASNGNFCPQYKVSDAFRARANQITVGPDDDWEQALASAPSGTDILMQDGTYRMTRYAVYLANPDITIRGASGNRDSVVIQGQGYGIGSEGLMIAAPGITVADLSMTAIRNHAISMKPEAGASTTYVYNVHLVDNGTQHIKGSSGGNNVGGIIACSSIGYTPGGVQGDYIGAIDLHRSSDWVIRDNYIYGVSGDGSGCEIDIDCGRYEASHPAILIWNDSSDIVVERNTVVDSWRAITFGLGNGFDGGVVRNNFIVQSEPGDAGIELWDAHNVVVEHNTVLVIGYPGAIEYGGSSNITLRNNLLSAEPLARPSRGASTGMTIAGNINDATTGDLASAQAPQLAAGSRAIGAGVASDLTIDIEGDPRDGRWDVGADQSSEPHANCPAS